MELLRKVREIASFSLVALMLGGLITLAGPATEANAAEPVNGMVTAIDAKTGRVTAREVGKPAEPTGRTFEFQVKDRAQLQKIQVGQKVSVDTGLKAGAKGSLKLAGGESVGIVIIGSMPAASLKEKAAPAEPVGSPKR